MNTQNIKFRNSNQFRSSTILRKMGVGLVLFSVQWTFAQNKDPKKDENIGTEVVNVVKPFTPTISDATKINEKPKTEDTENTNKEVVKYAIFSFPVASTFTPSKGNAEVVQKEKPSHLFSNYATLGMGNYATLNAELFLTHDFGSNDYLGGMLRHLSSQGGIDSVVLKDSFYNTSIDLTYGKQDNDFTWNVDLGYQNQIYNWYGLTTDFGSFLLPEERSNKVDRINPKQSYNNYYIGGKIIFDEFILKEVTTKFNHFSDEYGSSENRLFIKPKIDFMINDFDVKANIVVDFLSGNFKTNYLNTNNISYQLVNFGVAPSFAMQEEDWDFDLGLAVFCSLDLEQKKNKFFVYPKVKASLDVVEDLMIFYAGAEGELKQNTYYDFVGQNNFLSPTLSIQPTNNFFDIYAGLKGKLIPTLSYNLRASFENSKNKALFKSNDYFENIENANFANGNSFQVVYDDLNTLKFSAAINADISETFSFSIEGVFNSYKTKFQQEAWNLPVIQVNSKIDYTINQKWFTGVNIFFVGDRKDQINQIDFFQTELSNSINLASYFDLNAYLGYKYNDRWTGFLRINNIANQNYQKWIGYPVQGSQIVVGANYKFDL